MHLYVSLLHPLPLPIFNDVHLQFEFDYFFLLACFAWHQPIFRDRVIDTDNNQRVKSLFLLTYMAYSWFCINESITYIKPKFKDLFIHQIQKEIKNLSLPQIHWTYKSCISFPVSIWILSRIFSPSLSKSGVRPANLYTPSPLDFLQFNIE